MNYRNLLSPNLYKLLSFTSLVFSGFLWGQEFRAVAPENLAIVETSEGKIYVELAPQFAPNHVSRFKQFATDSIYNDSAFYRVIEGFVAQGGPAGSGKDSEIKELALEGKFVPGNKNINLVQENDLFAAFTAFKDGFALGMNKDKTQGWLLHCPGVLAMARGNAPHSATTEFYFVIGQAPRYLDGIMTVFGRVIHGMDSVQRIKRASPDSGGVFEDTSKASQILSVTVASDIPEKTRPQFMVEDTNGKAFKEKLNSRKHRKHEFFFEKPPAVLDACQVPLAVKVLKL